MKPLYGLTLRELDAEIAKARGWVERDGIPIPADGEESIADALALGVGVNDLDGMDWPPPYSSQWALAGILIESIAAGTADTCDGIGVLRCGCDRGPWCAGNVSGVDEFGCGGDSADPYSDIHHGATPCEAIARAWYAWKREQA